MEFLIASLASIMKKIILICLSLIIGLAFVVWLYQHIGLKGIFSHLGDLSIWQLVVIFVFQSLAFIFVTTKWRLLLKDFKVQDVPFKEAFKIRLTEFAACYFFPFYLGTEIIRPSILKIDKGASFTPSFISVIIDRLAEMVAIFIFLIFGAILLLIAGSISFSLLILFLAVLFLLFLILVIKKIGLDKILSFFVRIFGLKRFKFFQIRNISIGERIDFLGREIANYLRHRQSKFPLAVCLSFFVHLIWLIQAWVLLGFFGYHLSLEKIFLIKIFVSVASLIPIPARLGTYEAAHVLIFNFLGLSAKVSIAFTLVIRLMSFIIVAFGILFGVHYLVKLLSRKLNNVGLFNNKINYN